MDPGTPGWWPFPSSKGRSLCWGHPGPGRSGRLAQRLRPFPVARLILPHHHFISGRCPTSIPVHRTEKEPQGERQGGFAKPDSWALGVPASLAPSDRWHVVATGLRPHRPAPTPSQATLPIPGPSEQGRRLRAFLPWASEGRALAGEPRVRALTGRRRNPGREERGLGAARRVASIPLARPVQAGARRRIPAQSSAPRWLGRPGTGGLPKGDVCQGLQPSQARGKETGERSDAAGRGVGIAGRPPKRGEDVTRVSSALSPPGAWPSGSPRLPGVPP